MKIWMQLLKDRMKKGELILQDSEKVNFYYQLQRCHPLWEEEDGVLLLGRAGDFSPELKGKGLICIGKPAEELCASNDILWFEEKEDMDDIFMRLQQIILHISRLEEKMMKMAADKADLKKVTDLAAELFENSVMIHDQDFYQLAASGLTGKEHAWEFDEERQAPRLSIEILNDFNVNKDYIHTLKTRGSQIFPEETFGYPILYQNLWHRDEYRGRILVNATGRPLYESDALLLERFAGIIKDYFQLNIKGQDRRNLQMASMLCSLIAGERVAPEYFDTCLLYNSWTRYDQYFCACLYPQSGDRFKSAVQYNCNRLREAFPFSCVFEREGHIVALINLSMSDCSVRDFRNRIATQLREGFMKAGISMPGKDLKDFAFYYKQAVCAYEAGKAVNPTFWSFAFEEYQADYLLQKALQDFPIRFLCRPELTTLREYDRQHDSEYAKTLSIYLRNERALIKTAERLDIHRTTLLYRIRRIEQITGLSLDDEKVRFELLLSMHLLDADRRQQS